MDCEPVEKEGQFCPWEIGAGRPAHALRPRSLRRVPGRGGCGPRLRGSARGFVTAALAPRAGRQVPSSLPRAPPAAPEPIAAGRARQLSRAPRGLRQAGNLLLFVECFCHATLAFCRWRWALRRWRSTFFFFFSLLLALAVAIVLFPKKKKKKEKAYRGISFI